MPLSYSIAVVEVIVNPLLRSDFGGNCFTRACYVDNNPLVVIDGARKRQVFAPVFDKLASLRPSLDSLALNP